MYQHKLHRKVPPLPPPHSRHAQAQLHGVVALYSTKQLTVLLLYSIWYDFAMTKYNLTSEEVLLGVVVRVGGRGGTGGGEFLTPTPSLKTACLLANAS